MTTPSSSYRASEPLPKPGPWNLSSPVPSTIKKSLRSRDLNYKESFPALLLQLCFSASLLHLLTWKQRSKQCQRYSGASEGAPNHCLKPIPPASLRGWPGKTCSPDAHSTTWGCWPSGSEPAAQQPLLSGLFLVIWGQKRGKLVRSVKLSVASQAVNAWGQWCTCWATQLHKQQAGTSTLWKDENWAIIQHQSEGTWRMQSLFVPCGWKHEPRGDGWPRQSEQYRHTGLGTWEQLKEQHTRLLKISTYIRDGGVLP